MFTVVQVNNYFGGLIKCASPFDGAIALGLAGACAFQPSTSPKWMKHLIMVTGGNWCFWNCLNAQILVISFPSPFPSLSSFLFFPLLIPEYFTTFRTKTKVRKCISNAMA